MVLLAILFTTTTMTTAKANPQQSVKQRIEKLLRKRGIPKKHLSIQVGYSGSPPLYQLNEDQKRVPASLTKVITAAMILRMSTRMSEDDHPKTQLLSSAPVENGVLMGDLYLKGFGDPGFVSEDMWVLVNDFLRSGIKTVAKNIVVDDSHFDQKRFDDSRQKTRVDRAYDSPIGAMSFNWNSASVYVRPGAKVGEPARVFVDPQSDHLPVVGRITTHKSRSQMNVRRQTGKNGDAISVAGTISQNLDEKVYYRSITEPDIWSAANLKSFLRRRGITVMGGVKRGRAPEGAIVLAEKKAKPLGLIVRDMQKFSNNFVAEMLVKWVSSVEKVPGTMPHGTSLIRQEIKKLGWKDSEFSFVNPSGLSRKNQLTAYQVFQVLEQMEKDFKVGPEFISSLPKSGIDGTLKKRIDDPKALGVVRAKTGYLSGVVGLSGYVKAPSGQRRLFVFLYNGPSQRDGKAKDLFDELATGLSQWSDHR